MAKKVVPNPNFKGFMAKVPKEIGTQCKLCMVLAIQVNLWLTKNKPIIFIRVHRWTNTQRHISNQRCKSSTRAIKASLLYTICYFMGMEIGYQILEHVSVVAKVWQQICLMCIERENDYTRCCGNSYLTACKFFKLNQVKQARKWIHLLHLWHNHNLHTSNQFCLNYRAFHTY